MAVLIGGFLFSGIGLVALGYGKKTASVNRMMIGGALMVIPYFVTNVWLLYGSCTALTVYLFYAE